ncbi:MAG: TraR/DksA family transcriptional regulator [Candidatus Alcyoniella australis]|nr:TraR/DksA family transcriptional regulator [Candidatus Alcyoniella australis]
MRKRDLDKFRKLLLTKRDVILNKTRKTRTDGSLHSSEDMRDDGDHARFASEQAFNLRMLDKDQKLLRELDHALKKFETGEYGICEGTGEPIDLKRLQLRPWTRYSVEHKRSLEKERKSLRKIEREAERSTRLG